MDLDDVLELGFLFGGAELVGELLGALVGIALLAVVVVVVVGTVLLLRPDLLTVVALLGVAAGSGVGGGLLGAKIERTRRKYVE